MPTRRRSYLLIVCGTLLVACGDHGDPTKPANPTPTPTPTVATCTAAQPVTSFTATPATITSGDSFTLSWAAPCGYVSLAQKDQGPFVTLQPSTGSYTLTQGAAGYPAGAGTTVYVATNGDTAQRFETTVTMNPKAVPNRPPTVGVAASASTCHPLSPTQPCTVTCTASASDPDGDALGYAWSGCASGSGSSATCTVSNLTAFTCSVSVSDGRGGTATGSTTVTGTNLTPQQDKSYYYPNSGGASSGWWNHCVLPNRTDAFVGVNGKNDDPGDVRTCTLMSSSGNGCTNVTLDGNCGVRFTSGADGTSCAFQVRYVDGWGAGFTADVDVAVQNGC